MSRWSVDEDRSLYPCRILMFIDTTNMSFGTETNRYNKYIAIVCASEDDNRETSQKNDCLLIESFESDRFIRMISCNSIVKPIFVLPDVHEFITSDNKHIFKAKHRIIIKDRKLWLSMFINMKWV